MQEDAMIRKIVEENDSRLEHEKWKWSDISEILQERIEGCVRSGKQCRERYPFRQRRWFNHLDPAITQNRVLSDN
jgi:hypothetical protein